LQMFSYTLLCTFYGKINNIVGLYGKRKVSSFA
jgi:hypothetical protein